MVITWAGLSCFIIEGETATVVFDPFHPTMGRKLPKVSADAVIMSANDDAHGYAAGIGKKGEVLRVMSGPGEYEVKDVMIYGVRVHSANTSHEKQNESVIYKIHMDGMHLVHLGGLFFPLENSQLDHLEKTDIMCIPVGGGKYLDGKTATELVNRIEPRIVIPCCFAVPGMTSGVKSTGEFCKEIGICPKESIDKLKIQKKDLPAEETRVVLLTPR